MHPTPAKVGLETRVSLAYVDSGPRSRDALVLLPGLSDSWRSYELVLPHLPATFRTIAVSQRGHGDSDKPESGYTVRDFAADLYALLAALEVERAVIAAHSSASIVARRFAIDHREKVVGLVLEGSFLELGEGAAQFQARLVALEDPVPREFARDLASATFVRPVATAFIEAMIEENLKAPARVWRQTFASLLDYDDAAEIAGLDVSTLVIWGDEDAIIDRTATETLVRSVRNAKLVVYEGVGHTPHWEDPARFGQDVAAFVEARGHGAA
ncbi:MAG TPA: alpha/beta hydrolase [Gemmatimonadaceae bacterium]|nr:alpha/beta hydrolase [Gemmatimonadaceae bacterium]